MHRRMIYSGASGNKMTFSAVWPSEKIEFTAGGWTNRKRVLRTVGQRDIDTVRFQPVFAVGSVSRNQRRIALDWNSTDILNSVFRCQLVGEHRDDFSDPRRIAAEAVDGLSL